MSLEALSRQFDVSLALALALPADRLPSVPECFARMCSRVVVEGIAPGERSLRHRIESLPGSLPLAVRMLVPNPMELTDYPPALLQRLASAYAGHRFDAMHVFRLRAVPIARTIAAHLHAMPSKRMLDLDDIESRATRRHADLHRQSLGRIAYLSARVESAKLKQEEKRASRWFERLLVCSEVDRRVLAMHIGADKTAILPNGIRIPERVQPIDDHAEKTLLFVGSLDYPPNIDAVEFLLREILPALHRRCASTLTVRIVGRRPSALLQKLVSECGAELHADAPSIAAHYAGSDVVVAPIRTGGGTRIKILEAFAFGRPVVSTTIGAEGLEVDPGRHLMIADDPESFAEACVALLQSTNARQELAAEAALLVQAKYSPNAIAYAMGGIYGQTGAKQ